MRQTQRSWRRVVAATVTMAAAAACLASGTSSADAVEPEAMAANDYCSAGGITDVVDRTNDVSGGGWMNCVSPAQFQRLWVTLYRDGVPMDSAVCERPSSYACDAYVRAYDDAPGAQTWQTEVRAEWQSGMPGNVTVWTNTLLH
ncbi:hypothetical protein [Solicola gregarius]|uniref:Secreted protein n=1 Tax=Solicola gregarius TaxID=2908642 RepID=A0AA46TKZ4_9ACTN|nr:hypothetical protein [Solicola gregarius]UYM07195.1 hypothetical protein L0C25_08995 [Solicola gregarius]